MKQPTFTVYRDAAGQYRWRLTAANGRTIADSAEAYTRRRDCLRAVDTVLAAIFDADIVVEEHTRGQGK